ncbi:4-hydroxy-2-oxoheptanedioate aldolase [Friedmanniella luteola]|uniref:4-hydroxy-2-oxoheptanedioate aldolase n=1 Tax=Friedmanniella luteola TaxID=546871 RepID=A0A1H1N591_9ACTN|nr:aldolase/citrate lyase family protein [Friedmanniella luteola]SDR93895.1 4-hydroxy-2-oxoheptanedioate aldolase [Friedmanniella luteola]
MGTGAPGTAAEFAGRVRGRSPLLGYWVALDAPPATERLAATGYDFVVLDAQHGLIDDRGVLAGLTAVDAARSVPGAPGAVGVVRVAANDPTPIGRALDSGAAGVIVPLVSSAAEAAGAVRAARYPPDGIRSFGPLRSGLRVGPSPVESNAALVVLAMVETPGGLADVAAIAATPGLDGLFVGPNDLRLALGAPTPDDPAFDEQLEAALVAVREACDAAGIAAGLFTTSGEQAARRLAEGFTFVCVSGDLTHLEQAARDHLAVARGGRG